MGAGPARNPWVAGLLSGLLPGLGQFYNRQWGKGAGFLLGVFGPAVALSNAIDPKALEQATATGEAPDGLGLIFLLLTVILAAAAWSLADAVLIAKKS